MKIAVYAGSFDPFTNGHLDVLTRACALFDRVYVGVLTNTNKHGVFTVEERIALIRTAIASAGIENADAAAFGGLLVDLMKSVNAQYIVRGLRSPADYDHEAMIERANAHLMGEAQTVYFSSSPENSFISSTVVREIGSLGGDISGLVPDAIKKIIAERLIER